MRDNFMVMQYKDIAKELGGFTERQVRAWINHNCYRKIRSFNDSYFDNISTPNQAYWLGFIYADGAVMCNAETRNYELQIELNSIDKYILEEFNQELGGKHKIKDRTRTHFICNNKKPTTSSMSSLRVYSKRIVEDLIKHNVIPNKTLHNNFPIVSNELFWDFLRGYFDGDGCLYVNYESPKTKSAIHITSAHREVLDYLHNILESEYDIDSRIYQETERKYRIMIFTHENIMKFLNGIYYSVDITKLNRKYEKYEELALLCGDTEVINRAKSKEAC